MSVTGSGIGVLDRSVTVLEAVRDGARSLDDLTDATGLPRTTAYRVATALERAGLLALESPARWRLGLRLLSLGAASAEQLPVREAAQPVLADLVRTTGESAQLYVRADDRRVCVDVVESAKELRTIVQVGASLPLVRGSAGKVLLSYLRSDELDRLVTELPTRERRALIASLPGVLQRGWADSVGEREPGVASVSAPVLAGDTPVAVVSVSGPLERTTRNPGTRYARDVTNAARKIERALGARG
ncbi:MAG: IclR family transcriptional regulator [Actinomycetota bacterium]